MKPELVVMAAGVGSRYGGLKQLEGVGPSGERLLDYAVFDAMRAGVERVVFVIRKSMEADFHAAFGATFAKKLDVAYAFQEPDQLPEGITLPPERSKPWGTAHAVLAAASQVRSSFVVINADDFYGATSFSHLVSFLTEPPSDPVVSRVGGGLSPQPSALSPGWVGGTDTYAMVAFDLANTLSEHGTVARGVCAVSSDGYLRDISELTALQRTAYGACQVMPDGRLATFPGVTPVSMNFWGLRHSAFEHFRELFARFLTRHTHDPKAEFYITVAIGDLIEQGAIRVKVLSTEDRWIGMTYQQDKPATIAHLQSLVAAGAYPRNLWSENVEP